MVEDTIIVLPDGSKHKLTPKAIKFIDNLENFFAELGVTKEEIPSYLEKLAHPNQASNL